MCKSDVCVGENERRMVEATTEKYPETEYPQVGSDHTDKKEIVYNLS
jgi:hypothetical protein